MIKVDAGGAPAERRVEVIVTERWRGNVPARGSRVDVYTRSRSLCGYPFKTGREYLIYGSRTDAGRIATSLCSRTAPLERATEDLHYANLATTGIVPAGRIIGDVRLRSKNARRDRGVSNVRMTLRHQGKVTQTVTDEDGRYTLELTSAGRYELDVELPETQYAMQPHHVLDVPHAHACLERDIDVLFNGRIAGRVIDALGRGVGGLIVTHVPSAVRARVTDRTSVLTRDDGSYEIARLPPGPFSVRMELPEDGPSDETQHSGSILSEGVLGEGDRLALPTFSLSPSIAVIRLEGMIVGTDGWSMADARVFLRGESSERILGVPAVSDALVDCYH
ncbi:MAG TPA: hypothetical protein VD833_03810 [Vicinamibacterales bacterium]|nr:hypothetical protein [Vicinamibacterales bacterium]